MGAASVETDDRAREAGSRKRLERPFAGPVGPEFVELLKAIIVIVEGLEEELVIAKVVAVEFVV